MIAKDFLKQIEFIKEIDKIKYIHRKTKLFNSDRNENDAEHSWHLAMMALVLSQYSNAKIDLFKVIKMLLIHDIVEIDAGDTFLFDKNKDHNNYEEEEKCAIRIFGMLPAKQGNDFLEIWKEFEEGNSPEAKFARSLDNLEPILQNVSNNGGTWKEFSVNYETVYNKKKIIGEGSDQLWYFTKQLLNDSIEKGILED